MLYSVQQGIRCWINRDIPEAIPHSTAVGFAHQRLSIVDLSDDSLQPMVDESNRFSLIYNGEIYNYIELRAELEALGYNFKTSGDTEVLLRAYEAWGPDCMRRLNGMWAFVLLDTVNQRVIFSRDRFGIKPLYYTVQNGTLYFASEIKGLLAIPTLSRQPNERAVAKFLLTGIVDDTEETFFDGIFQFPAAHWAAVSVASPLTVEPQRYWSFPTMEFHGTERQAITRFHDLFLDSVKIHLRSDVPVGTCLSGGLDSSAIVCVADRLRKSSRMPNFSHLAFGYTSGDEQFDEKKFMDIAARASSAQMNYITFDQDQFESKLSEIVAQQDEPFGSASIIAQWFVFERAKEAGITVMLDGQGADETLAGYHFYFPSIALNLFHNRELLRLISLKFLYQESMGEFPVANSLLFRALIPDPIMKLLRVAKRLFGVNAPQVAAAASVEPSVITSSLRQHFVADGNGKPSTPPLNDILQHHVQSLVLPALLRYEDRNSMAHSIEARVPFLDYRLVEHLFSLPGDWKIKGVTTKNILREAMKGILPKSIRSRKDKIGFKSAPNLTFEFARKRYDTFLKNETEFEKAWFNSQVVAQILNCEQTVSNEFILWRVLGLKLWVRQFWG